MKKLTSFYFSLILFYTINFIELKTSNHESALFKQIIDFKSYQMILFSKSSTVLNANALMKNTEISQIPTVMIDVYSNQSNFPSDINLSRKSLLVHIQDEFNFNEIQLNVENFTRMSRVKMRPKYLVICNDIHHDQSVIKSILLFGLSKKFLDLTVVNIRSGEVFFYNPFSKVLAQFLLGSASIFPNKIKNMMNFPLRIPFFDYQPYFMKEQQHNFTEYSGIEVDSHKFLASALNFEIKYIQSEKIDTFESDIKLITAEKRDILAGRYPLFWELYKTLEIGKVITYAETCAVTSYQKTLHMELSLSKLAFLASNIILAFSIANLIHCILLVLKIESDIFEVIRSVLGQARVKIPKTFFGKTLLLLLGLFSMLFFPDIVAELTQILENREEKSISTYNEILDADLQPYAFAIHLKLRADDEFLEVMLSKTIEFAEDECLNLAIQGKNVICFVSVSKAKMYLKK